MKSFKDLSDTKQLFVVALLLMIGFCLILSIKEYNNDDNWTTTISCGGEIKTYQGRNVNISEVCPSYIKYERPKDPMEIDLYIEK